MNHSSLAPSIERSPRPAALPRWWRGLLCSASLLVAPFTFRWMIPKRCFRRVDPERLEQGLVLILPGIEGRSFLNLSALHGLIDAGVPYAVEIFDWTTGHKLLAIYHLRAWRRNQRIAQELAERIRAYQADYPGRPVWIIGHSGGGGMALLTAAALPEGCRVTGLILLAAAVSRRFDLSAALAHVERGIWSYHSWWDCFFVGLGTTIFGCLDGPFGPAAGMLGFRKRSRIGSNEIVFEQIAHSWRMVRQFNAGGHFGCVHRVFVAETIAPLLMHEPRASVS